MVEGLNGVPTICVPFAHDNNCLFAFIAWA